MTAPTSGLRFGFIGVRQPFMDVKAAQGLLDVARYVDDHGFHGFFYVDHMFLAGDRYLAEPRDVNKPYQLECYTTLASVAAVTRRVQVGPLVTPIPLRQPSLVAKMAATIDVFSGGRFVLGVGAGWGRREFVSYGVPYDESFGVRFAKTLEGVDLIKALWTTDGPVTYRGKYYQLDEALFWPKPAQQPYPPIWFGGSGPKALDAVARVADGWAPSAQHYNDVGSEAYRQGLATIRAKAVAYGRNPDEIVPAFNCNTSIAETKAEAWQLARAMQLRADWTETPLESMRESGVLAAGDAEDCIAHLQRYVDAGARYINVCPVPMTIDQAWRTARLYAEHVLPYVMVP